MSGLTRDEARKLAERMVRWPGEWTRGQVVDLANYVLAREEAERARAERAEKALHGLFGWVIQMPDAGFADQSPRWEWWYRGVEPRRQAWEVLAAAAAGAATKEAS